MYKDLYRIIVLGPTGAGKSQFCNFAMKDLTNSINVVSDSFDSCTQNPYSNFFRRNNINLELIDTPGSSDSSDNDVNNLETLVNYLKAKKEINHIILCLKFGERINKDTREYLCILGKIFTSVEFFTHLSVCFTKYPLYPSQKEINTKNKYIMDINEILRKIFNIDKNIQIPNVKIYFVDTEINEYDNTYKEKFQDTVDLMLNQIILNAEYYHPIDTTNLDITGANSKLKNDNMIKEMKELQKMFEQEEKRRKDEEKEKIRLQNEIKKMKNDDNERKKKIEQMNRLIKMEEEQKKKNEEIIRKNQQISEEKEKKQKMIEEMAKKKDIKIDELDGSLSTSTKVVIGSGVTTASSVALLFSGLAIFAINPAAGAIMAALGAWATVGSGTVFASSGIYSLLKKIIKG